MLYSLEPDLDYLGPERSEKIDAYLPAAAAFPGPRPAVLLIHGGGWRGGDKADARERNIAGTLASHGYAVFSANYLLNTTVTDPATGRVHISRLAWPQNLHDCKSALRWIRAHARRFNVDPARIATMGESAGGHLAMLVGATVHHSEINRHGLYTDQSNAVSCILTFYGDYDVRGRASSPFAGATPTETLRNETAASPITYLDASTPPIFITHGTADLIVPVERSKLLADHLRGLGVVHRYIEIEGAPHSYDLEPEQRDLRPDVLAFLRAHLAMANTAIVPGGPVLP